MVDDPKTFKVYFGYTCTLTFFICVECSARNILKHDLMEISSNVHVSSWSYVLCSNLLPHRHPHPTPPPLPQCIDNTLPVREKLRLKYYVVAVT